MQNASDASSTTTTPTRRRVLRTAGLAAVAVGGAAAVAACGSDTPTTAPSASTAPETSAPASSAPASPGPSATETEESEPVEEAPSGPSVATGDVPVGGGVIMDDADYVVTQPERGKYKAFSKICTHMGCPVARVADKQIACDCHQSRFSITDGSVAGGPATKPLPEYEVEVSGGKVYVQA